MAENNYATGHVKRNPVNGAIATRTSFSEDNEALARLAWIVVVLANGQVEQHPTADVADWDDLYAPPVPDA